MISKVQQIIKKILLNEKEEDKNYIKDCEKKVAEVEDEIQLLLEAAGLEKKESEDEEMFRRRLAHLYAFKRIIITAEYILIKNGNMTYKKIRDLEDGQNEN